MKNAKALIKILDASSFTYSTFAYHFVAKASGPVLLNFFKAFEAIANVLGEKVQNDSCQTAEEYELGILSLRIGDALAKYNDEV